MAEQRTHNSGTTGNSENVKGRKIPSSAQAAKQIAEPKIDKAVLVLTPANHKSKAAQ